MLEDKLRATDWEATNEAMEEAVARESYLNWLQDSERRARGARGRERKSRATERMFKQLEQQTLHC